MLRGISTNRTIANISDCLRSADIDFVCRYYSSTTKQLQKRLTLDEAKELINKGIQIVTVFEDGPTDASYFSASRGQQDGRHANEFAAAIGQAAGSAIYFAVDYDASDAETQGVIEKYFEGVIAGLAAAGGGVAQYDIGVYGSGRVCSHIKEVKELAKFSWLAESHGWAGHATYPRPDIRQEVATSALCKLHAGVDGGYEDNFALGNFGAFSSLSGSAGPATIPLALTTGVAGATSAYAKRVAAVAQRQYDLYHQTSEEQSPLKEQIRIYWEEIGFTFPGVQTAWSAVLVSWIMRNSGAGTNEFKASNAHSRFVFWAIANLQNNTGLFHAHRLEDYAPRVGDIIHNNRNGQILTYAFAAAHQSYESHSAIVVEVGNDANGGYAITVGGNEADTVGRKRVSLHPDGKVLQRASNPYICVIQNLK
jgi:hypothetical protein